MTLKEVIEARFGEIEKMTPDEKSKAFLEVYRDLAVLLSRDFHYQLVIVDIEKKDAS